MNRTILYARVSSKEQESEGFSIPAQLKLLREYAKSKHFQIVQEFTDAETAKKAGRTGFSAMLQYLEENPEIKTVLVEKTDRLYRNFKDYVLLDDYELEVHLVKEGQVLSKDSKSHEKFIHGIKVLMAKNYIDNLSEEVKKGMQEKVEQGGYPRSAPLGYKNNKETHELEVDELGAKLIQFLFQQYVTGDHSLMTLRKKAQEQGFFQGFSSYKMAVSNIHKILQSPIYIGKIPYKGKIYQGNHPPLISQELFDKVQTVLANHSQKKGKVERKFAFMGLMVCGDCGCSITAEIKKGKYVYYHCTKGKGNCDNSKHFVREEKITHQFGEVLKDLQMDQERLEWVKEALRRSHQDEKIYHDQMVQSLETELKAVQERMNKAYEDKIDEKITLAFWEQKSTEWTTKQQEIIKGIELHKKAASGYLDSGIRLLEKASKAYELYLKQNALEQRKLLNFVLSNSVLSGENLAVTYKKPFSYVAEAVKTQNWLFDMLFIQPTTPINYIK